MLVNFYDKNFNEFMKIKNKADVLVDLENINFPALKIILSLAEKKAKNFDEA